MAGLCGSAPMTLVRPRCPMVKCPRLVRCLSAVVVLHVLPDHKSRHRRYSLCVCVCVFMALIATLVLCARSQDLAVSMRRVHVVLSTTGFGEESRYDIVTKH